MWTAHHIDERLSLRPTILDSCNVAGVRASLRVAQQGEVVFPENLGVRGLERSIAPDSNTLYGIASITKVFTASAIGVLMDEGSWTGRHLLSALCRSSILLTRPFPSSSPSWTCSPTKRDREIQPLVGWLRWRLDAKEEPGRRLVQCAEASQSVPHRF